MNYIGYYRVSTKQQGDNGVSLDHQRRSVKAFVKLMEGDLVGQYTEVASGGKIDREELLKAIKQAQQDNAIIVVKRIDRLSRDGFKISTMMEELGVEYIDCDSPNDSDLVKNIKLAVAKEEKEKISARVRDGLEQRKRQLDEDGFFISRAGNKITKLGGNPDNLGGPEAVAKSVAVRKRKALTNPNNQRAASVIQMMREAGKSWKAITRFLNENGFITSRGNKFSPVQVKNLYIMFSEKDSQ